jgi:hypothetical protein
MVAPFRMPYRCAKVLSIVRAYANDGSEKVSSMPAFPQISTLGIPEHNPKDLPYPRPSTRWQVEYEKFVSASGFHIHSHRRRVVLNSFRRFPMAFQTAPFFPHRRNKDGSFNSICLKCFATVASHMTEEELKEQDKNHVCVKSILSERGNHVSLIHNENEHHDPR